MANREAWYIERNDRSLRYAGRVLPPDRPILLRMPEESAGSYDSQVSVIVAATLLSRMTPAVAFDVPCIDIAAPLPWAGNTVRDHLREIAFAADPRGMFEIRSARDDDYILTFGKEPSVATVHGSGWNAFVGPSQSTLPDNPDPNPIGPALASILAVARLFALQMKPIDGPYVLNAFNWSSHALQEGIRHDDTHDLGSIWTVGTGSVGTAAVYFLSLATQRFSSVLFDLDDVKVHNLDRSPIFTARDAELQLKKVHATAAYLQSTGVRDVLAEPEPLDKSELWLSRQAGTPDLVIATANERDVRSLIERSAPPLQIYGTTGANWEASVIRHVPFVDACSCCLFPPDTQELPTECASGKVKLPTSEETVDASLPFLSFAAGLMAAAEILKATMPGYPFSTNRTTLYTHPEVSPRFVNSSVARRASCFCASRRSCLHRVMMEGTKYEALSR